MQFTGNLLLDDAIAYVTAHSPVAPVVEGLIVRGAGGLGARVIISTMNDLPGYDIEEVLGEVFGLTVRVAQRRLADRRLAEVARRRRAPGMTKMLAEGRKHATERLVEEAEAKGADAIPRVPLRHLRARAAPGPRSARTGRR